MTILIFILFAFGAAFIQRTTGFGFGIFIMTVLPYLLPSYGEATTLSGALAMLTSLVLTVKYRHLIVWRKLLTILLTFVAVSFMAIMMLRGLSSDVLRRILGATLIAASLYFWFFSSRIKIAPNVPTQVSLGGVSGIMGGLFGMQGPPAVLYFLAVSKTKEEYTAIAQAYFLIGNVMMTLMRAYSGFVTHDVMVFWCVGVPSVIAGTWVGGLVYRRLSLDVIRKVVYVYIGLSGAGQLLFCQ